MTVIFLIVLVILILITFVLLLEEMSIKPDIIPTDAYLAELLEQKSKGMELRPPPSIPGLYAGNWYDDEIEAMKSNRRQLWTIYEDVSGKKIRWKY